VIRPESRTARNRSGRVAALVGAMIGAVALAGCGAGQITQTSDQVAAVAGANATVGPIAIRNARIEFDTAAHGAAVYLAGSSAPLEMSIVDTSNEADTLVSASSPVASAVQISGTTTIPGGRTLVVAGAPTEAAATPTATAAPAATDTAAPAPAPTTAAPTTIPAPITAATPTVEPPFVEQGTASIVLTGLRQNLEVGPTYPVTLTFQRAGSVQIAVPVASPDTPRVDAH
jgi:copper(I)-binding protein